MIVTPLGQDKDCSLKNREPDVPAPWSLDPGGRSKTATVRLYFIFPGICTLSLRVPRTGWLYRNLENPESVSDLIYQMAIMAMGDQTQPSQQELSEELLSQESLLC
ncbi:hypothetical protein STEG23_036523 [Scotinomys teguina]